MTDLPGVFGAVAPFIEDYGLAAVALFVFLENLGVPLPGEATVVTGAIFAQRGRVDLTTLLLVAVTAATLGDNLGYAVGRFGGRPLVLRLGRRVRITPEHLDSVEAFFDRHGGKVVVAARFLPLLRHLNGAAAGISSMPWRRFVLCNTLGAVLWASTWTVVGYQAGNHINGVNTVLTRGTPYLALVLLVLAITLLVRRKLRSRGLSQSAGRSFDVEDGGLVEPLVVLDGHVDVPEQPGELRGLRVAAHGEPAVAAEVDSGVADPGAR